MKARRISLGFAAAIAVSVVLGYHVVQQALAQEGPDWMKGLPQQHKSIWKVHDINRPKPVQVAPGATPGAPPSDAIVLFDGKDASQWNGTQKGIWKVDGGDLVVNDTGTISTKEAFGDCQLHLEYMAPTPVAKVSQGRGNSGILFMGRYELQVLDNWDNPTYPDGYIGSVYGQHPPLVLPIRKPGEWQTFDVIFRRPRFVGKTDEVAEPARMTVFVNGVLVQHDAEVYGSVVWRGLAKYRYHADALSLTVQDHGDKQNPRFRNIWIRKLDLSADAIDNRPAQ